VLEPPPALEVLDRPLRVLADVASALVRAEPRVVVDRVAGEMRGDQVRVAGIECAVVAANVVEVAQRNRILADCPTSDSLWDLRHATASQYPNWPSGGCRFEALPLVVIVNAATGAARSRRFK
jgi:hypothetical protein